APRERELTEVGLPDLLYATVDILVDVGDRGRCLIGERRRSGRSHTEHAARRCALQIVESIPVMWSHIIKELDCSHAPVRTPLATRRLVGTVWIEPDRLFVRRSASSGTHQSLADLFPSWRRFRIPPHEAFGSQRGLCGDLGLDVVRHIVVA